MEGARGARGVVIAGLVALLLLVLPAPVGAAALPVIHVSERFTTTLPDTPTGQDFTLTIDDPAGASVKPPALLREVLQLPDGARFDPSAIPQCDDTDQQLLAAEFIAGLEPCPDAYLGLDKATMDTGNTAAPDSVRYITPDVDEYNARRAAGAEVVFVARDPSSGRATTVFYGTVSGGTLSVNVPFVPGSPPDGQAADRGETQSLPAIGRYRVTPPTCPPSGEWVSTATFYFKDGATDTTGNLTEVVHTATPCTTVAAQGPGPQAPGGVAPADSGDPAIGVPNTGAAPAGGGAWPGVAAMVAGVLLILRARRVR